MFVEVLTNGVIHTKEGAGFNLVPGLEDGRVVQGLSRLRTLLESAEEAVNFTLHGGVEKATEQDEETFEGELTLAGEIGRFGAIFGNKSLVIK